MNDSYIQAIIIVGSNLLMMLTFFGISISMHNQSRNEMVEMRKETNSIIESIRTDMKDFHDKLSSQDLEFKMRLTAIEESKKS